MSQIVFQSFVLILSLGFVFAWQNTPLSNYTIQVLGFLIFLFILVSARKKGLRISPAFGNKPLLSIFILNTVIFLFIFSTGGLTSALFFLLYFLVFGIAFVFTPETIFVFVIGAVLIFLPQALENNVTENFLKLGSLALISPIAFFFGKEYLKQDQKDANIEAIKERAKDAADTISQDVGKIIKSEEKVLKPQDMEKLNDILEETENLREEKKE
ncbi:MAG: hypothetical protein ABIC96_04115 [Patescibacteria group bacterium]